MKKTLLTCALASTLVSHNAMADWIAELNYTTLSEDDLDVNLGVLGVALGYEFQVTDKFVLTPEFRLGYGVKDDEVGFVVFRDDDLVAIDVNLEVDNYYGAALRGEYYLSDAFYALGVVSYVQLEISASIVSEYLEADESELGYGAGLGYAINDNSRVEATYENFDGTDAIKVGFRYAF